MVVKNELEKIGYKMGVKLMCDLEPYYKKDEQIFSYLFDYKTGITEVDKNNIKKEIQLYLHLGNALKTCKS